VLTSDLKVGKLAISGFKLISPVDKTDGSIFMTFKSLIQG